MEGRVLRLDISAEGLILIWSVCRAPQYVVVHCTECTTLHEQQVQLWQQKILMGTPMQCHALR